MQLNEDKFSDHLIKQTLLYSLHLLQNAPASMAPQIKWKMQKPANNSISLEGKLIIIATQKTCKVHAIKLK